MPLPITFPDPGHFILLRLQMGPCRHDCGPGSKAIDLQPDLNILGFRDFIQILLLAQLCSLKLHALLCNLLCLLGECTGLIVQPEIWMFLLILIHFRPGIVEILFQNYHAFLQHFTI